MKKSLLHIVLISILAVGFTGCGLLLPVSEPVSLTPLIKEEIILSGSNGEVEKGALLLKNGSKIFDPEGDILESFVINNETFYIVKIFVKDEAHFKIKNSSNILIDEFKANSISWFIDDNKFVLLTKLERNQSSIYDNIYDFDGKKFNLIGKNLDLGDKTVYQNSIVAKNVPYKIRIYKSGMYYIRSVSNESGAIVAQSITNVITGKEIELKDINKKYEKSKILGIRNNVVFFTYLNRIATTDFETVVEAYDLVNKKSYVLSSYFQDKIQFLTSGEQVVLKIFDNKNLLERRMHIHLEKKDVKTIYGNEPAKIISLNTLKEVKSLSDNFEVMPIYSRFENLAGKYTLETYMTFPTNMLSSIINYRGGEPLF